MAEQSDLTKDVVALAEAMIEDYEILMEEWAAIPFMQEQLTKQEYRRRFMAMTQEQRLEELRHRGTAEVLRLMKGD